MKFEVFVSRDKNPGLVSRIIMRYMGTNYSHIGVIVNDAIVFHSHKADKRFTAIPLAEFLDRGNKILGSAAINVPNSERAFGFLRGRMGTPYSHLQYLGIAFPKLREKLPKSRAYSICSEEVAHFLNESGVGYSFTDLDFITPKDVWDVVHHEP